jgi:hypothetical protein
MCQSLHRRKMRGIGSHNCFATAKDCLIRLVARQYRIAVVGHRVTEGHSEGRIFLMPISGDGLFGEKRSITDACFRGKIHSSSEMQFHTPDSQSGNSRKLFENKQKFLAPLV